MLYISTYFIQSQYTSTQNSMKSNTISASELPSRLREIPEAPKQLWYRGTLPDEKRPAVAIVGTRKPTAYGRAVTEELAGKLAERGVVIVSGLALGIDSIAHQAALKASGITVAVLPSGVDTPYPSQHRQLAEDIVGQGGALISEYPLGMPGLQHHFLERNRLVSGLSDAVIVTEAANRSGTFNTVSHALAQGKDVYAVPGNILSPMSHGPNQLITTGATPIIDIDAWIDQLFPRHSKQAVLVPYAPEEQLIIDLIVSGVIDGDEIHAKSGLETAAYLQTITMLEITGAVRALGNNQWSV